MGHRASWLESTGEYIGRQMTFGLQEPVQAKKCLRSQQYSQCIQRQDFECVDCPRSQCKQCHPKGRGQSKVQSAQYRVQWGAEFEMLKVNCNSVPSAKRTRCLRFQCSEDLWDVLHFRVSAAVPQGAHQEFLRVSAGTPWVSVQIFYFYIIFGSLY